MTLIIILQKIKYRLFFISVSFLHVLEKKGGKHKCSTAIGLLAYQLGRPVGRTHVIFQPVLPGVHPSTAKLLTEESFLFPMNKLDVGQQVLPNSKGFWTEATFEPLPLQVNLINMYIQLTLLSKRPIAAVFFAWEWPLPQVNCVYMRNQGFLSGKHLIATILVASEGPLLQMNLINMYGQVPLLTKFLLATIICAWEWPLLQMNLIDMPLHVSLGYELGLTTVLSAREESPLQLNFIDMFLQAEVNKKPVAW